MKSVAKLTSKGQVTVPKGVRKALGVRQGDGLEFALERGQVVVRAVKPKRSSAGILSKHLRPNAAVVSVDEMDRGIAEHLAKKHRRSR
jgi:AbrB family looped-hinge helix DNA binding protein